MLQTAHALVVQVADEMTEALANGATFNPEMFGAMLRPGDNPFLRWRDRLLLIEELMRNVRGKNNA